MAALTTNPAATNQVYNIAVGERSLDPQGLFDLIARVIWVFAVFKEAVALVLAKELGEDADPVAALFGLAPVRIEDANAEI